VGAGRESFERRASVNQAPLPSGEAQGLFLSRVRDACGPGSRPNLVALWLDVTRVTLGRRAAVSVDPENDGPGAERAPRAGAFFAGRFVGALRWAIDVKPAAAARRLEPARRPLRTRFHRRGRGGRRDEDREK